MANTEPAVGLPARRGPVHHVSQGELRAVVIIISNDNNKQETHNNIIETEILIERET